MLTDVNGQLAIGCLKKHGNVQGEYLPVILSLKYIFIWVKKTYKTI